MPAQHELALARLNTTRHRPHHGDKRRVHRLDTGLTVELPGPRLLAVTWALPHLASQAEIYRSGTALVVRPLGSLGSPTPLSTATAVANLHAGLSALVNVPGAVRCYEDLKLFATEAEPATWQAYLLEVLTSVRHVAPELPRPPKPSARAVPKTDAEYKAARRERERAQREGILGKWLSAYLRERAVDGSRVLAGDLYQLAASEEFGDPEATREVWPGPRQFYEVADELIGPRYYSHGRRFYLFGK